MTTYDNLWQLLTAFDSLWQLMTTYDNLWQLMTAYDSLWQFMTTYDNLWQLMTTYDNLWQLMTTTTKKKSTVKKKTMYFFVLFEPFPFFEDLREGPFHFWIIQKCTPFTPWWPPPPIWNNFLFLFKPSLKLELCS